MSMRTRFAFRRLCARNHRIFDGADPARNRRTPKRSSINTSKSKAERKISARRKRSPSKVRSPTPPTAKPARIPSTLSSPTDTTPSSSSAIKTSSRLTTANPHGTARRTEKSRRSLASTAHNLNPPGSITIHISSTQRKISSASHSLVTRRSVAKMRCKSKSPRPRASSGRFSSIRNRI